jgi:hypothetical protein
MSQPYAKSTRTDKIRFLMQRPKLWPRPEAEIRQAMLKANLISAKTYVKDLRIPLLVMYAKQWAKKP